MAKIQIGIACGENCEHYVNFLMDSIRKTVSGVNDVRFIFGINRECVDVPSLLEKNDDFEIDVVYAIDGNGEIPSAPGHGRTLDVILKNMSDTYGMFVDCDCAFLEKNWDELLLGFMSDKIVIVGSEYDGKKYMKFPNIVGCIFKTKVVKDLVGSLVPHGVVITIDEENSLIYGREVGEQITLDVGWELCYKLKINGYDGLALPLVRTQDKNGKIKSKNRSKFINGNMRGEEYQLDGVPIFTHVGRSSSRDFSTDPIIIEWRTRVEKWLDAND